MLDSRGPTSAVLVSHFTKTVTAAEEQGEDCLQFRRLGAPEPALEFTKGSSSSILAPEICFRSLKN